MAEDKTDWDQLNENQKRFIEHRLSGMGRVDAYMKAYDCDNRVSATANVCRLMIRNDNVKAELDRRLNECISEAMETLRTEANRSAEAVATIRDMGNKEYTVRLAAAKDILDRVGLKPTDKHEHSGQIEHIVTLQDVILQSGLDSGKGDNDEQTERGNDERD